MYKSCVRSAFCYGAECWALKKDGRKLQTTKMRMLRMIFRKTLRDDISNAKIREITGVEKMFLREQRLQWLGHMERMDDKSAPVNAKNM